MEKLSFEQILKKNKGNVLFSAKERGIILKCMEDSARERTYDLRQEYLSLCRKHENLQSSIISRAWKICAISIFMMAVASMPVIVMPAIQFVDTRFKLDLMHSVFYPVFLCSAVGLCAICAIILTVGPSFNARILHKSKNSR